MATQRVHHFHAETTALRARLDHPITQELKPQAFVKLSKEGGYLSEHSQDYRVEGVVAYKSAYTHVAGHKSPKPGHGWVTLVTAAIEHLNVLDVVTADRVVGQIATEHPVEGYVPSVTFLGTRFENLRIAGDPVEAKLDLQICGPKPDGDKLYLEDPGFLKRAGSKGNFPGLREQWQQYIKDNDQGKAPKPHASVECSLVSDLKAGPWKTSGNRIDVPEFGKIFLAELRVDCDTFHLSMIRLEMGCLASGMMTMCAPIVNGSTYP